jgi:hypothetical protein
MKDLQIMGLQEAIFKIVEIRDKVSQSRVLLADNSTSKKDADQVLSEVYNISGEAMHWIQNIRKSISESK